MASRLTQQIDGEGAAWAAGGFAASILIGILIEPFRGTVGLENVVMIYLLLVVLTAAVGGRAAGLLTAVSAALSYDFFLTTPYHTLVIDSLAQVITVALLLATGLAASLAGRARRRRAVDARQQADALRLLNTIAQAAATDGEGDAPDQAAAEGLRDLLGARRVMVRREGPTGAVVADIAADNTSLDRPEMADVAALTGRGEAGDVLDLPRLDEQGRLPRGIHLWRNGRPPRPPRGAVADLIRGRGHEQVGEVIVIMDQGRPLPPTARLTLATVAHLLAALPAHTPSA
jgi:K+-sensing histidine kinase KdpD